jgi:hypothetical protein
MLFGVNQERRNFFVSYTSVDEGWAAWIAHALEEFGYTVVLQAWDFRPGSNFVIEMQRALQSSDRLIAVLSPDYLAARYPQPEWAAVFAADPEGAKRRLVPVMVRECRPDGLLSQVVQIRIHNLDMAAAKQKLLAGVKAGRAKPVGPPPYPGATAAPATDDGVLGQAPARLAWRRLPSPPVVAWRSDLDNRLPNQSAYEAVEVHLVPVGDDARLQVGELNKLSAVLPGYGRQHGVFSTVEALDVRFDAVGVVVSSTERGKVAGLAVNRSGQRSTWSALPRDMLGAILDPLHLTDQLTEMLDVLAELPLPAPELIVPAAGIESARLLAEGKVAELPRSSAQLGHGMPENVRPTAEDAVVSTALRTHGRDVAAELVARLVAEYRSVSRFG